MSNSQVSTLESTKSTPPQGMGQGANQQSGTIKLKAKSNGHDVSLSGRKAMVTLHPGSEEGGSDAQVIGINGFMWQVPRGEPVEVPIELLWVMENAVTQHVSTRQDGSIATRETPRFAYTVHSQDPAAARAS